MQDGTAVITAEFRLKPVQEALDDVRDAVQRTRSDLPGDLRDPVITKMNLSGSPILTYTISSSAMDDEALSWFIDNQVTRRMLAVRAWARWPAWVASRARSASSWTRADCWACASRPPRSRASCASSSKRPRAGAPSSGAEQSLRAIGTVADAQALAALDISLNDGRHLRLDQIATVSDTVAERRSGAFLNGKPVVGFEITRTRGAGELDVANGVRAALEAFKAEHPDLTVTEAFNFVDPSSRTTTAA